MRNRTLGLAIAGGIAGMAGLSFASVPLYRLFCAATGFGGTPKVDQAARAPGGGQGRTIRVFLNADTNPGLPWKFGPEIREIDVPLGDDALAVYRATNRSSRPAAGMALYNVTPEKAAKYFHKTACFCFDKQTLDGGQTMDFPVSFWIDPAISADPATADVRTITLSYTFYPSMDAAERSGALAKAGPHIGGGPAKGAN